MSGEAWIVLLVGFCGGMSTAALLIVGLQLWLMRKRSRGDS